MKITVEVNTCNKYTWVCVYIVLMDACNFQGAYVPKPAKIVV